MDRNLFSRWASVGIRVSGKLNPFEDPEKLVQDTLSQIEFDGRLIEFLATWISVYGHLLITKKLQFNSSKDRRLFSALVDLSGRKERKLLNMIQKPSRKKPEFVFENILPILRTLAQKNPDPVFLKQGLIMRERNLIRPKILMLPKGTFNRNLILRNRALYGTTLRSDLATLLPQHSEISVRQLAIELNVADQSLHPIIQSYVESALVEWTKKGRSSTIKWNTFGKEEAI